MNTLAAEAAEKTIKVALVGCGSRGTGAIDQALRTKGPIKLWAMADMFADRLENSLALLTKGEQAAYDRAAHPGLGSQIDVPPERRFVGFDAYRQAIRSGVDVVILATPPHFRPLHFECAVAEGKHLFMEKPLAVDSPGIRRILAANEEAKRKRLKVGVGFMFRHHRGYQETIARIHQGAIGPIYLLRAYWNVGSMARHRAATAADDRDGIPVAQPLQLRLVERRLHRRCLAAFHRPLPVGKGRASAHRRARAIGRSPIARSAATSSPTTPWNTRSPTARRCSPPRGRSPAAGTVPDRTRHGYQGVADLGNFRIEGTKAWHYRGGADPYQVEHDVLMEAIRQDKPHSEVDQGAMSTMTAIMGRLASYSGQMLRWEEALNSKLSLAPERYAFDAPPPVVADAAGNYPCAIPGAGKVF